MIGEYNTRTLYLRTKKFIFCELNKKIIQNYSNLYAYNK